MGRGAPPGPASASCSSLLLGLFVGGRYDAKPPPRSQAPSRERPRLPPLRSPLTMTTPRRPGVMRPTLLALLLAGAAVGQPPAAKYELVEPPRKLWDRAEHNAFTDLLRHGGKWYCVFREGAGHAKGAGAIRLLRSVDGKEWASAALITRDGTDLRDPHLSVTP